MGRFKWDRKYLYWGLTAFFVIAASVLVYFIMKNVPAIGEFLKKLVHILSPFILGGMLAFILHPLMEKLTKKIPKWLAVLICVFIIFAVIIALIWLIIPQLAQSLETIVVNSPGYIDEFSVWVDKILKDNPELEKTITTQFGNINDYVSEIIQTKVLPHVDNILTSVTSGVYSMIKAVLNLFIGIIVAVYILCNLNNLTAGTRKILYSVFTVPVAEKIRSALRFVDRTFLNFFSGKSLDSLIIGIICYIFCAIVKMPYALLVSVIVGVTNIIPFFGPFIGAIPSAFLILLVDPVKCLIFIVFIIILQQIDGNFIGPTILGSSTGISGFWVMFSIILAGGLFGFWGMLFGLPTFVCIYTGIKSLINKKLERSELPVELNQYKHLDYIDQETGEAVKKPIK